MRQLLIKLIYCALKFGYNKNLMHIYQGIRICDVDDFDPLRREQNRKHFVQALEIIKQGDPRRFRRVQRRLAYIVNGVCLGGAEYNHPLKVCYVDLKRFDFTSDEKGYVLQLARALVHEATHGEVEAHGITYNKSNRLRVERLCYQEEMRFLALVMPEANHETFDKNWWEDNWELSSWQRARKIIERVQKVDS